jgi:protoheme IX farnesyltransferase
MGERVLNQVTTARSVLADYVSLAKPGIVGLTLVAALTGIYFANHGVLPHWSVIFWTFLTLGFATAGSCMLNNFYDRDIDRLMKRTRSRPLAAGEVPVENVLVLGLLLVIPSLAFMAWMVNPLTALITGVGVFGYVVVYTMMTKRTTPWANQLGGVAGAVPPMIGYAAITGDLGAPAWVLFAIMVVWQQPHALSLALKYRHEYARAGVPVIPVAKGVSATKRKIALYCLALIPVAMLPYFAGMSGGVYLFAASVLSLIFLAMSVRFLKSERDCDMRIFAYSIVYLILLFGTMILDSI